MQPNAPSRRIGLYLEAKLEERNRAWMQLIRALASQDAGWMVDCLEDYTEPPLAEGRYSTEALLRQLEGRWGIFEGRMLCLPAGEALSRPIHTWNDFLQSNCRGLILCVDCGCFEIYAKDITPLEKMDPSPQFDRVEWMKTYENGEVDRYDFTL